MTEARPETIDAGMATLLALLKIVGPAETPALLHQLCLDLTSSADTIRAALPRADWLALRRASHNLIALAGTTGAAALQGMAETLNQAANVQDRAAAVRLGAAIDREVAALVLNISDLKTRKPVP